MPQEDARGQGENQGDRTEYLGQPPVRMRGVPLVEQFVQDLGDPVVDRVAETGQELLARLSGSACGRDGWMRCPWNRYSTSFRIFCSDSFCSRR